MEELTDSQKIILDALDVEIDKLERRLRKVQPLINELQKLQQTRRVLLSERSTTGGGGRGDTQLTMEMVVAFMRENDEGVEPAEIAEHYGVAGQIVRSHLNRGKNIRYRHEDGKWFLMEQDGDSDEEDEEDE